MELRILEPREDGFVKKIDWNHEELKAEIAEKMKDYKRLVFTEETIREAKVDRANLRKLKDAFETERKRIKKLCMEPYEEFEKQVKEVVALIEEPILLIDNQIKEVEERKKVEKKGKILEFYEGHIGVLKGILPFEKVFKPEYLNVSKTMKSIQEELQSLFDTVNTDLDTVEGFGSKYELQIKDVYIRTLDLSAALRERARLEEVERQLEERRAAEERRKEKKLSEAKKADTEPVQTMQPENMTVDTGHSEPVEEKKYTVDFRVTATQEHLSLLKEFFRLNHIEYGPVPKGGNQ